MTKLLSHFAQCCFVALAISALASPSPDLSAHEFLEHIKVLSSQDLKGRRTGTAGATEAAEYIARKFRTLGLKPMGGSYLQPFEVSIRTGVKSGSLKTAGMALNAGEELLPINLSQSGEVRGSVVFAGYGISAPEYGYDDYTGVDSHGKVVMVLLHEPQENVEASKFAGREYTSHAEISSKLANAKLHGASGVVLVRDLPNHNDRPDGVDKFEPVVSAQNFGIVAAEISAHAADKLLRDSGQNISALCSEIDKRLEPHSFELPKREPADLRVNLHEEKRTVNNVVGFLPGQIGEYEIIGAHYDHLGLGEQDSLAPSQVGTVHPGADDNASGVAGVLELARHFSAQTGHKRGILFTCFTGEEEGLLGSGYMAGHMPLRSSDAVAMINLDMIGRLRDGKVYVGGTGTGSGFAALVKQAGMNSRLTNDLSESGGYGASDHTSFTTKRIPTLFFFTGLHSGYHKPSDTWDKINAEGGAQVLQEVAQVALAIADAPLRPAFGNAVPLAHSGGAPGVSGTGYGPYFGSVPDFGHTETGVRFADVREGSPAARAGLKGGDILVEFAGKKVQNLYDFTYLLREHKPSEVVRVKVIRDLRPIEVDVMLTERR